MLVNLATGLPLRRTNRTARYHECVNRLCGLGIDRDDATTLRRISMTLHAWHELECGTDRGAVVRDEETHKTFWMNAYNGKHYPTPDRETGALRRLETIMARYPDLVAYVQTDPRGAALYILRRDIPTGSSLDSCYSRGVAVYK